MVALAFMLISKLKCLHIIITVIQYMKMISIDVINCHLTYGHSTLIHGLIIIMQNVIHFLKEGVKWPSHVFCDICQVF